MGSGWSATTRSRALRHRGMECIMANQPKGEKTKIDNRSQLIYALTEVAELEHVLMCQYLYAAASIKGNLAELPNKKRKYHQFELLRKWKRLILRVAREEMQHLAYAQNLLVSVGGAPTFTRPNFPCSNRFYREKPSSPGVEMTLEAFSLDTINRFIRFETNHPEEIKHLDLLWAVPDPNYYETLPEFYRAVRAGFTKEMFVEVAIQYDPVDEGGESIRTPGRPPIANTVTNVEEARALLDQIILQGEGASADDPQAHLNIFRRIRAELQEEQEADPKFQPSRPVVPNPLTRMHDDIRPDTKAKITLVGKDQDGGLQYGLLQLFNGAYEVLLNWLFQLFAQQGSKEELRAIETLAFLPFMSEVIRPIMEVLTLVPRDLKKPTKALGASFEVTTNNFMVPSGSVPRRLTAERLRELRALAEKSIEGLAASKLTAAAAELRFIGTTLRLMAEEFDSRVANGWPPVPRDKEALAYSESPGRMWIGSGPPVLELDFQGWFQCRLATDPDGAQVHRGVTGNAFAIGDEPDLDRIIRLQPETATSRSHGPAIGVRVTEARLLASPLHTPTSGKPVPAFIDARLSLLGDPKFEGRNHLVSEDGEPIDPFDLLVEGAKGVRLHRRVRSDRTINDMTPVQRRGSGRYPISLVLNLAALHDNLRRMGKIASPQDYLKERVAALKADLEAAEKKDPIGREAEELRFRLEVLSQAKPGNIRWSRFFFGVEYFHTLSDAKIEAELKGIDPPFKVRLPKGDPTKDTDSKWLVNYHIGFYDTDALCAYMYGTLRVPVELT
jgi:hypothetical protein